MNLLLLFGSTSDQPVYEPLLEQLRTQHQVHFEVISAHRNPVELKTRLEKDDFDIVIAGAGLAAHLPGVVASQIQKPVFGIPIEANFGGFDAFLSILQMPFGVPVLTCAPGHFSAIRDFLLHLPPDFHKNSSIHVVVPPTLTEHPDFQKEIVRLQEYAEKEELQLTQSTVVSKDGPNIIWVQEQKDIQPSACAIHVPFLDAFQKNSKESALKILDWANHGGLWVGVNNARNALLAFKKLSHTLDPFPLWHQGSVKNIRGKKEKSPYLFEYSDRYSVFDWGKMPDELSGKGKALAWMGWLFFRLLGDPLRWQNWDPQKLPSTLASSELLKKFRKEGCLNHLQGFYSKDYVPLPEGEISTLLAVEPVAILRPHPQKIQGKLSWDYSAYHHFPTKALVPLEVIFRFGVPAGSSFLSRASDVEYCKEIGVHHSVQEGDIFEFPIVEFSTKLESRDRYLSYSEATQIAGLSASEFQKLRDTILLLSLRLKDFFQEVGIDLLDGKFELAFIATDNPHERDFMLVDSIGPDELRLTYEGQQLSKENLRHFYKNSKWYAGVEQAKKIAQERGEKDWKRICTEELKLLPEPLEHSIKQSIEQMYQSLANTLSQHFLQKEIFPSAWSLKKTVTKLKK